MRIIIFSVIMACCLAGNGGSASAAENAGSIRGLIADRCTSCHEVPGYQARWERADLNAPSFDSIARNPEVYTPARLKAFLQKPHWPMTQFILSQGNIDSILVFIEQLR